MYDTGTILPTVYCQACGRSFNSTQTFETTGGPPPCQIPYAGNARVVYPGCLMVFTKRDG